MSRSNGLCHQQVTAADCPPSQISTPQGLPWLQRDTLARSRPAKSLLDLALNLLQWDDRSRKRHDYPKNKSSQLLGRSLVCQSTPRYDTSDPHTVVSISPLRRRLVVGKLKLLDFRHRVAELPIIEKFFDERKSEDMSMLYSYHLFMQRITCENFQYLPDAFSISCRT